MLGLIGTGWATPLDVEAAAAILSTALLGRTAPAAAKTLMQDETPVKARGSPAMIVAEALLAWKEGRGLMQVYTTGTCARGGYFSTKFIKLKRYTLRKAVGLNGPVIVYHCVLYGSRGLLRDRVMREPG